MGYVGNQSTNSYSSMVKQDLTGASGASVTLSHPVANANEVELYINNVRQEPTTSYTTNGTTLNFVGYTVAASDDIYVIFSGKALQTIVPPDGSVSTAKLADSAVSTAKIADNSVTTAKLQSGASFNPITNLQFFRVSSSINSTTVQTTIDNYVDAHNTDNFKRIGTAWSVSSGVFTPTVSGLYEINFIASLLATTNTRWIQINFNFSTDSGSNYTSEDHYTSLPYLQSASTYSHVNFIRYYNIPNPSTTRFKVGFSANTTGTSLRGLPSNNKVSGLLIKRLADAQ